MKSTFRIGVKCGHNLSQYPFGWNQLCKIW